MAAQDSNATEQALREHLLAQVHSSPAQQRSHALDDVRVHTSPQHIHNIDPAIAGSGMNSNSAGESGGDDNGSDGKKGGKRELSTSKRAAQNRAAQRAFRQRKEGHIKKLEEQVRDYNLLNENYKAVQAENYQLRDYIINLQSRLIESQGDFPQPPSNINLQEPVARAVAAAAAASHDHLHLQQQQQQQQQQQHHQVPAPTAPMASSALSQLQASAAQAVADLGSAARRRSGPYDPRAPPHDVQMQDRTDPQLAVSGQGQQSATSALA
ncbi:hypothetical protein MMC34_007900 [Xylographa carneopallida]|nr:hypothetical protein [Xylographa carneopallida]